MKMDPKSMKTRANEASTLMSAMASEKRLLILCQLVNGEQSVSDLAEFLETRQSTVSQHLALLRKDGLVRSRREAQTQFYSLTGDKVRGVLETLYSLYCAPRNKK